MATKMAEIIRSGAADLKHMEELNCQKTVCGERRIGRRKDGESYRRSLFGGDSAGFCRLDQSICQRRMLSDGQRMISEMQERAGCVRDQSDQLEDDSCNSWALWWRAQSNALSKRLSKLRGASFSESAVTGTTKIDLVLKRLKYSNWATCRN